MWSKALSESEAPSIIALNPASYLGTKMVKEGFGMDGKPLSIGADIIRDAALSKKFDNANGKYFDNDSGSFRPPHQDGTNIAKCRALVEEMDKMLTDMGIEGFN